MSKCDAMSRELQNPYLHSQVYFEKNSAIIKMNREMLSSQTNLNSRLSLPKRERAKFGATQTQKTDQSKSVTFIEKLQKLH